MSMDVPGSAYAAPDRLDSPAEFMAALRTLRDQARLSYRQLEARASGNGDRLPRSTIAAVLTRDSVPRESIVAGFIRACGGDEHTVARWLAAHRRVAAAEHAVTDLAVAVERWLTAQPVPRQRQVEELPSFAGGRLAQAVAQSSGERWVGLHRRSRRRARYS